MIGRKRVGSAGQLTGIAVLCVLCTLSPAVRAGVEDAGTHGAAFLQVPVGAAGMSVPDVVAGMDPDASLLFSNPATLGDLRCPQLFLSRASWLEDLSMNAASFGMPVPRLGLVWSLGTRLLYSGDIQGFDEAQNVVESDSYYGLSLSSAVSRRFSSTGIALGAGVTYSREHLPGETGDGVSFSLGASYARSGHRLDLFAENLGGTLSFAGHDYPIEGRYVAGYGYSIIGGPGRLDLGTQVVISNFEVRQVEFGGAYRFSRLMTVRLGYNYALEATTQSAMPLSAGLGFRRGGFSLDYAYTSQEYFSATHTFSVGFSFGAASASFHPQNTSQGASTAQPPVVAMTGAATGPAVPAAAPKGRANAPARSPEPQKTSYLVMGGVHGRLESAEAEVRALRLLKVSSSVERSGEQYRVIVARFDSRDRAETALAGYENRGHKFRILTQRD